MDIKKVEKGNQFCLSEEIEKIAQRAKKGDILEVDRSSGPALFLLLTKDTVSRWAVVNLINTLLWRQGTVDLQETLEEYLSTSTYNSKTVKTLKLHKSETVQLVIEESI